MSMRKGWLVWSIAAIFYGYEFLQRLVPSTMLPELRESFQLSATFSGSLFAAYFYAYALCLVPAGFIMDRLGVRIALCLSAIVVALGSLSYGLAANAWILLLSRALIGGGSAFAFIGCLKLASHWLPERFFPLLVGLTNLCGSLGAIYGGGPLAKLVDQVGWREATMAMTGVGFLLALIMLAFIQDHPERTQSENAPSWEHYICGLKGLLFKKQLWGLAIYGLLLVMPVLTFGELWSVSFLSAAYPISKAQAAHLKSFLFIGILFGGPIIGLIAAKQTDIRQLMVGFTLLALSALLAVLYWHPLPAWGLGTLFFVYGFGTSHMLLCFTLVKQTVPEPMSGVAIGLVNTVITLGGALIQPVIGHGLDWRHKTSFALDADFVPYSQMDFQVVLAVLPLGLFLAIFWLKYIALPKPTQVAHSN